MIPKEAIDRAAKAIASHYGAGAHNWEWYLTEAKEILEAAGPTIWKAGYDAAVSAAAFRETLK